MVLVSSNFASLKLYHSIASTSITVADEIAIASVLCMSNKARYTTIQSRMVGQEQKCENQLQF